MQVIRTFSSLEDAHLARMQLGNEGIEADILDEATASAAPHLAFASGIRLAVADEDMVRAREILGLPTVALLPRSKGVPWWVFVVAGVALFTLLTQAIRNHSSRFSAPQAANTDRNGDGKADERFDFRKDVLLHTWSDDNFDGRWDVRTDYEGGIVAKIETDNDFDGDFDSVTEYRHGVPVMTLVRNGGKGPPLSRIEYRNGVVFRGWEDRDGDGTWDLTIDYDPFGRETARQELK